jgi:hypothetical protein
MNLDLNSLPLNLARVADANERIANALEALVAKLPSEQVLPRSDDNGAEPVKKTRAKRGGKAQSTTEETGTPDATSPAATGGETSNQPEAQVVVPPPVVQPQVVVPPPVAQAPVTEPVVDAAALFEGVPTPTLTLSDGSPVFKIDDVEARKAFGQKHWDRLGGQNSEATEKITGAFAQFGATGWSSLAPEKVTDFCNHVIAIQ